mmetsp:Transcript_72234/g.200253  ORF Transcript_72234/g.200253 Transcript_72234/m.200253 type:complete len:449 (-) Transcript_72234:72-1418(-)
MFLRRCTCIIASAFAAGAVVGFVAPLATAALAKTCAAGNLHEGSCEADPSAMLQVKQQEVRPHSTLGGMSSTLASMIEQSFDSLRRIMAPRVSAGEEAKIQATSLEPKLGMCLGTKVECASQTAGLVNEASQYDMWYAMPPQNLAQMQDFQGQLTSVPLPELLAQVTGNGGTLSKGPAGKVARMMYEATKVNGLSENLPRELRGVYWMKGNPVPEELMVIQYAQWHEEEGLLVVPYAPWMWSWAAGRPAHAPSDLYTDDDKAALSSALALTFGQTAISSKFGTCKQGREHTLHPIVCNTKECTDRLAYGYMQLHQFGNLTEAVNIGHLLSLITNQSSLKDVSGAFTLQKHPHAKDGSMWRRTSQWGCGGKCASIEAGSYDLVKVIDADGNFVQPWYDEFIKYMGDVPLMTWSGWKDEVARAYHRAMLEAAVAKIQSGEWERLMPVLDC